MCLTSRRSTFGAQVGKPEQQVRLLPATGVNLPWVVLPDGCIASDPVDCGTSRGNTFNTSASRTWEFKGGSRNQSIYAILIYEEKMLEYSNQGPYDGNALYGWDTFNLGWPGNNLPSITNQTIAGIATKDFYMGSLGIYPGKVNFTNLNDPLPSMMDNLKAEGHIPSLSWGYTAGAYNYVPKTYGSLTLGGYDTTRFEPNNLTITFGADSSRDLLPFIQSITANTTGNPTLLSNSIPAFIDSLVPYIWLPKDACTAFEKAFGLYWNETLKLYLVNETLHTTLLSANPSVTFKIGADATGESVDIVMPYWAFDLRAGTDLLNGANGTSRYFPLKRAENDTQYTLGRAFLQSAYVIADYERRNFSVSQARYPSTSISRNLVAILPTDLARTTQHAASSGLSAGAIAGIVVGAIVILTLVGYAVYIVYKRRHKYQQTPSQDDPATGFEKAELDAAEAQRDARDTKNMVEVEGTENERHEVDGSGSTVAEVHGQTDPKKARNYVYEMDDHGPIYEMAAEEVPLPELLGSQPVTPETSQQVSRNTSRNVSQNTTRNVINQGGFDHLPR